MKFYTQHYDHLLRQADVAAATSAASVGVTISIVNEWVQVIAGLVAIVSGLAALYFHIERTVLMKKEVKHDSEDKSGP
jgi:hypothetical protein